jgi:hypothetical protein
MGPLINFEYGIGEEVADDLTGEVTKIIAFAYKTGNWDKVREMGTITYRVESKHLDGFRYPWEISSVSKSKAA